MCPAAFEAVVAVHWVQFFEAEFFLSMLPCLIFKLSIELFIN